MQDTLQVLSTTSIINRKSTLLRKPPDLPSDNNDSGKRDFLHFPPSTPNTGSLSLSSPNGHKIQEILSQPAISPSSSISNDSEFKEKKSTDSEFQDKLLYLDSLGLDIFSLISDHRSVLLASSLLTTKSTIDYLVSTLSLTSLDLRRLVSMSPDILTLSPSSIASVFAFLMREAGVKSTPDLKRVIHRRPRLLLSSVPHRLRPTLYFLQSIGISETQKHTYLLSCSVEEKLLPRIHYFEGMGLSHRDAIAMFRRFPQLFNYSLKNNVEPKLNYFVVEMGRDLKELRDYPHFFSFSLENRIKRRHRQCADSQVTLSLQAMLRSTEDEFLARLNGYGGSSVPLRSSPFNRHKSRNMNHGEDKNLSDSSCER